MADGIENFGDVDALSRLFGRVSHPTNPAFYKDKYDNAWHHRYVQHHMEAVARANRGFDEGGVCMQCERRFSRAYPAVELSNMGLPYRCDALLETMYISFSDTHLFYGTTVMCMWQVKSLIFQLAGTAHELNLNYVVIDGEARLSPTPVESRILTVDEWFQRPLRPIARETLGTERTVVEVMKASVGAVDDGDVVSGDGGCGDAIAVSEPSGGHAGERAHIRSVQTHTASYGEGEMSAGSVAMGRDASDGGVVLPARSGAGKVVGTGKDRVSRASNRAAAAKVAVVAQGDAPASRGRGVGEEAEPLRGGEVGGRRGGATRWGSDEDDDDDWFIEALVRRDGANGKTAARPAGGGQLCCGNWAGLVPARVAQQETHGPLAQALTVPYIIEPRVLSDASIRGEAWPKTLAMLGRAYLSALLARIVYVTGAEPVVMDTLMQRFTTRESLRVFFERNLQRHFPTGVNVSQDRALLAVLGHVVLVHPALAASAAAAMLSGLQAELDRCVEVVPLRGAPSTLSALLRDLPFRQKKRDTLSFFGRRVVKLVLVHEVAAGRIDAENATAFEDDIAVGQRAGAYLGVSAYDIEGKGIAACCTVALRSLRKPGHLSRFVVDDLLHIARLN